MEGVLTNCSIPLNIHNHSPIFCISIFPYFIYQSLSIYLSLFSLALLSPVLAVWIVNFFNFFSCFFHVFFMFFSFFPSRQPDRPISLSLAPSLSYYLRIPFSCRPERGPDDVTFMALLFHFFKFPPLSLWNQRPFRNFEKGRKEERGKGGLVFYSAFYIIKWIYENDNTYYVSEMIDNLNLSFILIADNMKNRM